MVTTLKIAEGFLGVVGVEFSDRLDCFQLPLSVEFEGPLNYTSDMSVATRSVCWWRYLLPDEKWTVPHEVLHIKTAV